MASPAKTLQYAKSRLRDIVEVRARPTVVRLDHLQADDSSWISSSYFLTGDVQNHFQALSAALGQRTGLGAFVIGQYGSGKSHFLAYLAQQLQVQSASGNTAPTPGDGLLQLAEQRPVTVAISLLDHRESRPLEDIVLDTLGVAAESGDRRPVWTEIDGQYPHGLMLLIDELSEFLRSKTSVAAFHEDVRFLQFLGEWAQGHRLWILAAMQEQIEHVGDLEYDMYRKIKDRFPLRFLLTPGHVLDLVAENILVKKPGYREAVDRVLADLRGAFPNDTQELDLLRSIFPIHPATLELLEEVRDRFSQSRGVVDFIVGQLNGVPERHIDGFLEQSHDCLLTPDTIVDHFRDLFELQSEYVPLSQQLLSYYRKHLTSIFESEKLVELAWRLLKLLILTDISPSRSGLKASEAVRWLSYRAVRIDANKNLSVVQRVLDTLADQGRYVAKQGDQYLLNLRDDGGAALDRFIDREKSELRQRGAIVLESLVPLLGNDDFQPFVMPREQWLSRQVRWHFHDRPYSVYVGDGELNRKDGLTICVRLPWGSQTAVPGTYTVLPSEISVNDESIELAALARAKQRTWSHQVTTRLESRFQERLQLFRLQIKSAYREAAIIGPDGQRETPPQFDATAPFAGWLDRIATAGLRRTYPSFERFAPVHGPLPKEAYRSLMRFVADHDLGSGAAGDAVRLIREAYLVPMKLMRRSGREYQWPKNPENAELIRLVMPLVEAEVAPQVVYQHLQGPVYGLVPDQISLLLITLLILGDVDILKGKASFRDSFETLPNPLQYDRIVPAQALREEHRRELAHLCESLHIRLPPQLTAMAQRRMVGELRDRLLELTQPLQRLQLKLRSAAGGQKVAERLLQFLQRTAALAQSDQELHGFQQFLFEVGTAQRFLDELAGFQILLDKSESILESIKRYQYLFSHPNVEAWDDPDAALRIESLGSPPDLEQTAALERWLREAQQLYAAYAQEYQRRHQIWWDKLRQHPVWTCQVPALAKSRHLGVTAELTALLACATRAKELQCRNPMADLDFQPVCHCGFTGRTSPIAAELEKFEQLTAKIDDALTNFFGQKKVRQRVQQWLDDDLEVNSQSLAYVAGEAKLPQVNDLKLFDQYLAGIELVHELDSDNWCQPFLGQTWEREELVAAVSQFLSQFRDARLRLRTQQTSTTEMLKWCLEQSLRHGVRLPPGVSADELRAVADAVQPRWVGKRALGQLEQLGLGETIENRVAAWVVGGQLSLPPATTSELIESLRELLQPTNASTAEQLATLAQGLYSQHERMMAVASDEWLVRLDRLVTHMPADAPPLLDLLPDHMDTVWVVIDALGLPLVGWFCEALDELFPNWCQERVEYALVSTRTTTDEWYRNLVEVGTNRGIEKLNAVDTLLHQRLLPLDDLWRLALAQLMVDCRKLSAQLPADRPLLIFADHGFRISADGRKFCHGGDSALERLVPLIHLRPR